MLLSILIDLDIGEDGGLFPFSSRLLFWNEAFKVFFLKLGEWVLEFLPLDLPIDPWDMVLLRTEGWSLPLGSSKIISMRSRFIPSMETIEEALDRVLGVLPSNFLSKYLRRLKTPSVPINRTICFKARCGNVRNVLPFNFLREINLGKIYYYSCFWKNSWI